MELRTTIQGVNYKVQLNEVAGRRIVSVRMERKRDDGTTVWAFLSSRQASKENQVKRVFAREINAFMAGE